MSESSLNKNKMLTQLIAHKKRYVLNTSVENQSYSRAVTCELICHASHTIRGLLYSQLIADARSTLERLRKAAVLISKC